MSWGEREVRKTRMTSSLKQTPSNICLLSSPSSVYDLLSERAILAWITYPARGLCTKSCTLNIDVRYYGKWNEFRRKCFLCESVHCYELYFWKISLDWWSVYSVKTSCAVLRLKSAHRPICELIYACTVYVKNMGLGVERREGGFNDGRSGGWKFWGGRVSKNFFLMLFLLFRGTGNAL